MRMRKKPNLLPRMERCRNMGLTNVFFIDGDAATLSDYFAPDEVDLIYINFCDPWPSVKHSRRRLTAEGFLRSYRKVLKNGGQIHFKSDNHDLFEWSLFQFPKAGFALSEVTRNLHENGICGIMTDYEEKFHSMGTPINRCVGTKGELPDVPVVEGLQNLLPDWDIHPVADEELDAVLALMESNPHYFELDNRPASMETLLHDRTNLPPRCIPDQKHYVAFWREGKPEALLDLVVGYPRERTLFVGLFMIDGALQRKGIGREIMTALPKAADGAGLDDIRLGCLKGNDGAHAFWEAMGWQDIREGTLDGQNSVWIMERLAGN